MTNEFWNENHDVLFAMFIIEANCISKKKQKYRSEMDLVLKVVTTYYNSWIDRAIADEEFEMWHDFPVAGKPFPFIALRRKIKFRFVED